MKIIVTGCAGFIGYNLCDDLLNIGYQVVGVDNFNDFYDPNRKLNNFKELSIKHQHKFDIINENVNDTNCFEELDDVKAIYHLASRANVRNSMKHPVNYVDDNIKTMVHILDCLKKRKEAGKPVPFLIYASSSSVYGSNEEVPFKENQKLNHIESPYALSKKVCEEFALLYFKLYGIESAGMRFFTVYGPHGRPDMAPELFLTKIYLGEEIQKFGMGDSKRDYTYVGDIIQGLVKVMNTKTLCNVYNIGNSNTTSLNDFIKLCEKIVGKQAVIRQIGKQLGDVPITYSDIGLAKDHFGYEPTIDLEEGLKKTFEWLKPILDSKLNNSSE